MLTLRVTPISRSGKGAHIWVKALLGNGLKRKQVELYDRERFIICTGHTVTGLKYSISEGVAAISDYEIGSFKINSRQDYITQLSTQMRVTNERKPNFQLVEKSEVYSDAEVMEFACRADNNEKFEQLCRGEWVEMGYPSQSEADLALMSMFAFYSESNEQCRRLFRYSKLGKREKAVKDDKFLNFTLKLIRARQADEMLVEVNLEKQSEALAAQLKDAEVKTIIENGPEVEVNDGLEWPPGFAGRLAKALYETAPRPVKEVSIVAALGFLAGFAGKAYNIPGSGLNVYIILVARSAIGKEAMHGGIGLLLNQLAFSLPGIHNFVSFNDFASGPALAKACAEQHSFINISGEWGRKLKRLAVEDRGDGPMQQLRTVMTNLYQKSGPSSVVGGMNYSDKEKNIAAVSGVSYSMIGETTPRTFYDSLTDSMMEDGFLSRFTIVEYTGDRPAANKNVKKQIDDDIVEWLAESFVQAHGLLDRHMVQDVEFSEGSRNLFDRFDIECDNKINETTDEGRRQMWNRAHLKAMRIAALLAVADNYIQPLISEVHAEWALALIRRDITVMTRRMNEGDIGSTDSVREKKLLAVLRDFYKKGPSKSYNVPEQMVKDRVVPRRYLQMRINRVSCFAEHKNGTTYCLDTCIKMLIDNGYLMELDKKTSIEKYGGQGRCFRIINIPTH